MSAMLSFYSSFTSTIPERRACAGQPDNSCAFGVPVNITVAATRPDLRYLTMRLQDLDN